MTLYWFPRAILATNLIGPKSVLGALQVKVRLLSLMGLPLSTTLEKNVDSKD